MAEAFETMSYLMNEFDTAPAGTREEAQVAKALSETIHLHGLETVNQDFTFSEVDRYVAPAALAIAGLAGILGGITAGGPLSIVMFVLALLATALFMLDLRGISLFSQIGARGYSQNLIARHPAAEGSDPRSRPIVIIAHYDTPRADVMSAPLTRRYLPYMGIVTLVCLGVVVVGTFFQLLPVPQVLKSVCWAFSIVAGILLVLNGVRRILAEVLGRYTDGANDNMSSVAALLGVLDRVRPTMGERFSYPDMSSWENDPAVRTIGEDGKPEDIAPSARRGRKSARRGEDARPAEAPAEEAAQASQAAGGRRGAREQRNVRRGAETLRSLGMVPETCEIIYVRDDEILAAQVATQAEGQAVARGEVSPAVAPNQADVAVAESGTVTPEASTPSISAETAQAAAETQSAREASLESTIMMTREELGIPASLSSRMPAIPMPTVNFERTSSSAGASDSTHASAPLIDLGIPAALAGRKPHQASDAGSGAATVAASAAVPVASASDAATTPEAAQPATTPAAAPSVEPPAANAPAAPEPVVEVSPAASAAQVSSELESSAVATSAAAEPAADSEASSNLTADQMRSRERWTRRSRRQPTQASAPVEEQPAVQQQAPQPPVQSAPVQRKPIDVIISSDEPDAELRQTVSALPRDIAQHQVALTDDEIRRDSILNNPAWGTTSFNPVAQNRHLLEDLPDPAVAAVDPYSVANVEMVGDFNPNDFSTMDFESGTHEALTPAMLEEYRRRSTEGFEDIVDQRPRKKSRRERRGHSSERASQRGMAQGGEQSFADWLGLEQGYDAKRNGREIGTWANFNEDTSEATSVMGSTSVLPGNGGNTSAGADQGRLTPGSLPGFGDEDDPRNNRRWRGGAVRGYEDGENPASSLETSGEGDLPRMVATTQFDAVNQETVQFSAVEQASAQFSPVSAAPGAPMGVPAGEASQQQTIAQQLTGQVPLVQEEGLEEPGVDVDADLRQAAMSLGDRDLASHEIWFVLTGASEASHAGVKAFLDEYSQKVRGAYFINLECVGVGRQSLIVEEGGLTKRKSDRRLVNLLGNISQQLNRPLALDRLRWLESEGYQVLRRGFKGVTIAGMDHGTPANARWMGDVASTVSARQIDDVVDILVEAIRRS